MNASQGRSLERDSQAPCLNSCLTQLPSVHALQETMSSARAPGFRMAAASSWSSICGKLARRVHVTRRRHHGRVKPSRENSSYEVFQSGSAMCNTHRLGINGSVDNAANLSFPPLGFADKRGASHVASLPQIPIARTGCAPAPRTECAGLLRREPPWRII